MGYLDTDQLRGAIGSPMTPPGQPYNTIGATTGMGTADPFTQAAAGTYQQKMGAGMADLFGQVMQAVLMMKTKYGIDMDPKQMLDMIRTSATGGQ